jgi:ribosome-binding factor A
MNGVPMSARKYSRRRRSYAGEAPPRKTLQLCSQVAETLLLVLAESADDVLRDLTVESVVPVAGTTQLLVTFVPSVSAATMDLARYLAHLEQARGLLRSEVAGAICRRKVPDLLFRVQRRPE